MVSYTPLFTTLTKKGMTKTELRKNIGFGTNALAKMSKGEYISLETIDKICLYLNCKNRGCYRDHSGLSKGTLTIWLKSFCY